MLHGYLNFQFFINQRSVNEYYWYLTASTVWLFNLLMADGLTCFWPSTLCHMCWWLKICMNGWVGWHTTLISALRSQRQADHYNLVLGQQRLHRKTLVYKKNKVGRGRGQGRAGQAGRQVGRRAGRQACMNAWPRLLSLSCSEAVIKYRELLYSLISSWRVSCFCFWIFISCSKSSIVLFLFVNFWFNSFIKRS